MAKPSQNASLMEVTNLNPLGIFAEPTDEQCPIATSALSI